MIRDIKPRKFSPKFEVVSCFVEFDNKILLLKRQEWKPQPDTYGVPAGKVEKNEDIIDAMIREAKEETGLDLSKENIVFYKTKYVKYEEYDFIYHIFSYKLNELKKIKLDANAHKEYIWEYPQKTLLLPLIEDLDDCIIDYYKL